MKTYLSLLLCLLVCTGGRAQEMLPTYAQLTREALAASQANKPRKALKLYDKAFDLQPGEAIDLLRAMVIAKTIKKHDRAVELTDVLFKKYPLEATVTFLESKEFEFAREEPLYSNLLHLAALALVTTNNNLPTPNSYSTVITKSFNSVKRPTSRIFQSQSYHYAHFNDYYIVCVEAAHYAMLAGDYARASQYYKHAFMLSERSKLSLLRASVCAYHNKELEIAAGYVEKAFKILPNITLRMVRLMPEFHPFLEYPQLRALVGKQIHRHFPDLNTGLVGEIDSLKTLFMTYRQIGHLEKAPYGTFTLDIPDKFHRASQDSIDLIISHRVDSILRTSGYPSTSKVADRLEDFDIIMHAVQPEVIESNWDVLLAGGSVDPFSFFNNAKDLANRYDSNCMRLGRKQKFGCIRFIPPSLKDTGIRIWPVENPQQVNSYRAAVGLEVFDNSPRSEVGYFDPETHARIGVLSPVIRNEVHAKIHSISELLEYPHNYQ